MKKFTQVTDALCRYVSYLSMAAIAFMMCYMALDVFLRIVFNKPIQGGFEVTTMALCVLVFSSWSYTQTQHAHIHVTMFISKMPQKMRFVCFGLTSLFSTVILALATWAVFFHINEVRVDGTGTGLLHIPHWPFVAIESVALCLFSIILLRDAIKAIIAIFNKSYAEEVMATW
jgi:TRAP-type C4-dicarboxylate transport system permease small subunit